MMGTDLVRLPKEKTHEGYSLSNIRALWYGAPKIGKSTFCSKFENALFLATEKGLKGLDVYQIEIGCWDDFIAAVNLLDIKEHDFKTINIDTVDNLMKYCLDYVCTKNRVDHPSDLKWGKGWELLQKEFEKYILKLSMSSYGLNFISHEKEYEITTRHSKYTKIGPSIPNQARRVILPFVDIIGRCYMEERLSKTTNQTVERRCICFKPSMYVEAGDRTGLLPETIPLRYEEFKKYFDGRKTA